MVPTLTLTLFTNIVHKNDIRMQCLAILTSDLTWIFWPEVRSPVELPVHVQMSMHMFMTHKPQIIFLINKVQLAVALRPQHGESPLGNDSRECMLQMRLLLMRVDVSASPGMQVNRH